MLKYYCFCPFLDYRICTVRSITFPRVREPEKSRQNYDVEIYIRYVYNLNNDPILSQPYGRICTVRSITFLRIRESRK